MTERCKPYQKEIERLRLQNNDLLKINAQLRDENLEMQDYLARLEEETNQIKNMIKEAYKNERTDLGKSVLKQLIELIE